MAVRSESLWIPIEMDSGVIAKVALDSAIEFVGRRVPMGSNARSVPRDGGVASVLANPGDTYVGDGSVDDIVTLHTFKFTGAAELTSEDLHDSPQNIVEVRAAGWLRSNNIKMDNSVFGVTATQSNTVTNNAPYTSLYNCLKSQNDTDAGYTAGQNYLSAAALAGSGGYSQLLSLFEIYETSDYFDPDRSVVLADPALKSQLRGIVDSIGRPIFEDSAHASIDGYVDEASSKETPNLFGVPMLFTKGMRTSQGASQAPTGNPLIAVGNRDHLIWGISTETPTPQSRAVVQPNADLTLLMYRVRRGFSVGYPQAWSILELTSLAGTG